MTAMHVRKEKGKMEEVNSELHAKYLELVGF